MDLLFRSSRSPSSRPFRTLPSSPRFPRFRPRHRISRKVPQISSSTRAAMRPSLGFDPVRHGSTTEGGNEADGLPLDCRAVSGWSWRNKSCPAGGFALGPATRENAGQWFFLIHLTHQNSWRTISQRVALPHELQQLEYHLGFEPSFCPPTPFDHFGKTLTPHTQPPLHGVGGLQHFMAVLKF